LDGSERLSCDSEANFGVFYMILFDTRYCWKINWQFS
jgi:hypothetical protein